MKKFFSDFKDFISKGDVLNLAVGVMIGGAFGSIVTSVVNDIFMPVISLVTGGVDFTNLFVSLDGNKYATYAEAQEAGAAVLAYGNFITKVVDFLLLALCVFLVVRGVTRLRELSEKKEEAPAPAPAPRLCPYCKSEIAEDATRCPHCTSELSK